MRTQKSSCSTSIAGHGFIHVMTTQDRQEEMGAILAQIAMIAEEVKVLALEGSGKCRTHAEQLACVVEVKLRVREILGLATGIQVQMEQGGS